MKTTLMFIYGCMIGEYEFIAHIYEEKMDYTIKSINFGDKNLKEEATRDNLKLFKDHLDKAMLIDWDGYYDIPMYKSEKPLDLKHYSLEQLIEEEMKAMSPTDQPGASIYLYEDDCLVHSIGIHPTYAPKEYYDFIKAISVFDKDVEKYLLE